MSVSWTYPGEHLLNQVLTVNTRELPLTLDPEVQQYFADLVFGGGVTVNTSTTATGKPVVHISGPPQDNPVRHWAPDAKENQQVASNSKAFKVVFTDGTERTVEANSVEEADGRLKFTGAVEGYDTDYHGNVVASFLSQNVAEYGVVPVPEEAKVGHNTYQVFFTEGSSQEVKADRVLYTKGSEKNNGQFTFVTTVRSGESRTEYLIGEDLVHHIERADGVIVPAQADATA